jgi:hypothetical protein
VCGMSSTRVGIHIEGLGIKFVIFCNFFRIFWTPNSQKWLVATASTREPIRSRHVDQSDCATSLSPALSPRQCLASLSPPSRPPLAHARAVAALSRPRYRPRCHQPKRNKQEHLFVWSAVYPQNCSE